MKDPDALIGAAMVAGGTTGLTVHLVTQAVSLGVLAINLILGIGGLWLLLLRLKKARQDLKTPPDGGC